MNILHMSETKLIGQRIELTDDYQRNLSVVQEFWKTFNRNIRYANIYIPKQWIKYGLTLREENKLYYFCALPAYGYLPDGFEEITIKESDYLCVEHLGSLHTLFDSYKLLHDDAVLQSSYQLRDDNLVYFERYTSRFQWNAKGSVIEIWVPVEKTEERVS